MAQTKIKAGLFEGIIGNGTDGYFLMSNGDGTMTWSSIIINPTIASIAYPGSVTAADPAGGETITVTGTGFKTGATVTIGGTAAPAVSYVSETQITFTTPAKAAGDYDIVVTNTDTGSATYINGISYNGIPSWTTAAGSLGTFASGATISTITLQATEPDAGTITFNITNGALPTGLLLTGANIDGTTSLETADTLYTFTVTATDDESQATPRTFTITVTKQFIGTENFTINTYAGNGSTQSIEGKIGTAAQFDGSGDYITTPQVINANSSFSLSMWVNPVDVSGCMLYVNAINNGFAFGYDIDNTTQGLGVWKAGVGTLFTSGNDVTANTWQHLVLTYDGSGNWEIYKDGVSIHSQSSTTYTFASATNSYIGRDFSTSFDYNGKIDQFRIFNKALSSSEVTTLYGENNTSTTKSTTDIFDDSSGVALYEFEKGAIDTGGITGYIGSAGVFNGSSSAITATGLPSLTTFSLSFWIKASDPNADTWVIQFDDGSNNNANSLFLHNFGTQFGFASAAGTTSFGLSTSDTDALFDNNWHNVVLTVNGSDNANTKMYVDGSEKTLTRDAGSGTATIEMTPTMNIGKRRDNSATRYLNGKIDQVRVFNKALSSSEVTTLSDETSASSTKSTTDIFDDGSGVALYELEGNANDTARFGRGAIDSGQSAVFNGSSSYIALPTGQFNYSNFTISSWVYPTSAASSRGCIISTYMYTSGPSKGYLFGINNDMTVHFSSYYDDSGNKVDTNTTQKVPLNTWTQLTFTFNAVDSKVILYINGFAAKTTTFSGDVLRYETNNNTSIGALKYSSTAILEQVFVGRIDQLRVFNSVLSPSDVVNLVSETNVPTANLIAHYKLDGNANDSVGSYNGTWSGTEAYSDPAEFLTYDGTATNVTYGYDGTPTDVSFVGTSFQPDFVWIKSRTNPSSGIYHTLMDSVRGKSSGFFKSLFSNSTDYENNIGGSSYTQAVNGGVTSFDSNGFTLDDGSASANNNDLNVSSTPYVAWCWKAGGTAVSNTDGSITSSVSANQAAGFSIVKYTGSSTSGLDIGHGLSSAPEMVILKNLDSSANWYIYHKDTGTTSGYINYLRFDATTGTYSDKIFYPVNFNASTFIAGHDTDLQGNMIAYCFHSVDGYQKVGSYTGTGQPNNDVTTGFRPRWVMIKSTAAQGWNIVDSVRNPSNPANLNIQVDSTAAESSTANPAVQVDFDDTGFSLVAPAGTPGEGQVNSNGSTYIYLAIA
jgi:hypothetical protein